MAIMLQQLRWVALLILVSVAPSWADAEQVRYHYVPVNGSDVMSLVPIGPDGAMGERKRVVGGQALPYPNVPRPTQLVTFRHPYSGQNVTVPLRLPADTPRMMHATNRIIYNYNDYVVEARFLPDGSVDVVYNSGLLRPLPF
jgi:hypothetical protein